MSEQQLTIEKPKRSLKHKAMKAGAIVFSGLALGAASAPSANAESEGHIRLPDQEVIQPRLKNIVELPGYKIRIGPEALIKLRSSTVEIIKNAPISESESFWYPNCTGVKVTIPGSTDPYIMTAGHCFSELTGNKYGLFTDPESPGSKAKNYFNRALAPISVADPLLSYDQRIKRPLATINGLSINTNNKDLALLRVAQKGGPVDMGRSFDQIPSVDLKISEKAPIPGEQIGLFGVTAANNFELVSGIGRYIGRVRIPIENKNDLTPQYKLQDIVAINPDGPSKDVCNFGGSGLLGKRKDGSLLGPLAGRLNGGYGPNREFQNGAEFLGETPEMYAYWSDFVQKALRVDVQGYTLCFFTVLDKTTLPNLLQGFNNFAPDLKPEDNPASEGKG